MVLCSREAAGTPYAMSSKPAGRKEGRVVAIRAREIIKGIRAENGAAHPPERGELELGLVYT